MDKKLSSAHQLLMFISHLDRKVNRNLVIAAVKPEKKTLILLSKNIETLSFTNIKI